MHWFASIAIKAVLEWLWSLLVLLKERLEYIEQGRQEVRDELAKKDEDVSKNIEELRRARIADDVGLDELRSLADTHYGKDKVSRN